MGAIQVTRPTSEPVWLFVAHIVLVEPSPRGSWVLTVPGWAGEVTEPPQEVLRLIRLAVTGK